jgi:CBS domain-containing protein
MRLAIASGMRCDMIMKRRVRHVREADTARRAAALMLEEDLGFLPVCDAHGCVVGVVTDRDLVLRVIAVGRDAGKVTIGEVMTPHVVACRPGHGLGHVEALMRRHRKSRIVVTGAHGELCGVISLSDIAQYERPARAGRALEAISARKYAAERP